MVAHTSGGQGHLLTQRFAWIGGPREGRAPMGATWSTRPACPAVAAPQALKASPHGWAEPGTTTCLADVRRLQQRLVTFSLDQPGRAGVRREAWLPRERERAPAPKPGFSRFRESGSSSDIDPRSPPIQRSRARDPSVVLVCAPGSKEHRQLIDSATCLHPERVVAALEDSHHAPVSG